MSIALMTVAWKSDLPSGAKMVLLALCDNSNDQGECYPSVSMLSRKCSMSERSVFNHIAGLEKISAVSRENRTGRSTIYHLDPCKFCTPANSAPLQRLHPTPANSAPTPLQRLHPTPANSAPTPLQRLHPTPATVAPITINEPSIEPSVNHQAPKRTAAPLVLPNWIPEETWSAFLETRKKKRAASTDYALGLVLKTLNKFREAGLDPVDILEASIKGGWSDVYAPKNSAGLNKQESLEARNRAVGQRWADGEVMPGAI